MSFETKEKIMATESTDCKMRRQNSFEGVLINFDDQVKVRELLMLYTPLHVQEKIIDEFNAHVDRYNARIQA